MLPKTCLLPVFYLTIPLMVSAIPASTTSAATVSTSASSDDELAYLPPHNAVRAQHGANNLTWSADLASAAQEWADGCVFEHSNGTLGDFGENLAAGTGNNFDGAAAVALWVDQNDPAEKYDPSNPQPSHFTQVVWKSTTELGCAHAACSFGTFHVCEYDPPGNVIGEFAENVQA